ncbi:MAG: hypothetical protein EOS20_17245 [Mesorhizobium sp.]|uniref:hypothetical protein n=1 Tax=Mesorhizobium sp. TaxID=1871066 RepID=UPI000FE7EC96|nr:hypothetical protein [Mesorhizobium sp.]RWQ35819.1 MAG: hypothetical protein EOS20_17245 [Mesorhizobium sp.]
MVAQRRNVAWLIERNDNPSFMKPVWFAENSIGIHRWTPIASLATRFASKAEAEEHPDYKLIATDPTISITKYVFLAPALATATEAAPDMVEVPREPTEAMMEAVSGMSISGPYLGSNEARDIWDAMIAPATQAAPDDDDRDMDLDAFHREVWGWLLKRGLVSNGDAEWDGFTTVIEEHEQEIEAAATRAAAAALTALQAENERLLREREITNAMVEQLHGPLSVAALTARAERAEAELAAERYALAHEIKIKQGLVTKMRELETEQARWTNAVAVTVPGVLRQDYMVVSPCGLAPPKPDVLYIDGAVYRRETA